MEKIYHQLVQTRKGYKNTVDTVHMLLRGHGGGLEPCCAGFEPASAAEGRQGGFA